MCREEGTEHQPLVGILVVSCGKNVEVLAVEASSDILGAWDPCFFAKSDCCGSKER